VEVVEVRARRWGEREVAMGSCRKWDAKLCPWRQMMQATPQEPQKWAGSCLAAVRAAMAGWVAALVTAGCRVPELGPVRASVRTTTVRPEAVHVVGGQEPAPARRPCRRHLVSRPAVASMIAASWFAGTGRRLRRT
jgi:hypothetical protein